MGSPSTAELDCGGITFYLDGLHIRLCTFVNSFID